MLALTKALAPTVGAVTVLAARSPKKLLPALNNKKILPSIKTVSPKLLAISVNVAGSCVPPIPLSPNTPPNKDFKTKSKPLVTFNVNSPNHLCNSSGATSLVNATKPVEAATPAARVPKNPVPSTLKEIAVAAAVKPKIVGTCQDVGKALIKSCPKGLLELSRFSPNATPSPVLEAIVPSALVAFLKGIAVP